jgi:hypothetical protein
VVGQSFDGDADLLSPRNTIKKLCLRLSALVLAAHVDQMRKNLQEMTMAETEVGEGMSLETIL